MNKKTRTWKVIWIAADDDVLSEQEIHCEGDARDALQEFMALASEQLWIIRSIERIIPMDDVWGTYGS